MVRRKQQISDYIWNKGTKVKSGRGGVCGEQDMGEDLNIARLSIFNLFQLIVESK